ncbi:HRD3 (YLR207W) [Zygosaccharomyces parabailii]|nr:HRD3 (YLR207W) [Zygosaccharomyces parabailii]
MKLGTLILSLLATLFTVHGYHAEDPWPEAQKLLNNSIKRSDPIISSSNAFLFDYEMEENHLYIPADYSVEREELNYAQYWDSQATEWARVIYKFLTESSDHFNNPNATYVLAQMHLWSDYGIPHNKSLAYKYLNKYNELTDFSDANALFDLAVMHCTGFFGTIPVDPVKGLLFYQKSASLGDIRAKQALAYRYFAGINVPRDCNKALLLYREVADEVRNSYTDEQWNIMFPYVESYSVRIPDFSEGLLGRTLSSMALSTKRMATARPDITSSFLTKMNGGHVVLQFGLGNGGGGAFAPNTDEDSDDRLVDIFFTAWDDYKGTYAKGRNCERARRLLEFAYKEYDSELSILDDIQRFFYGKCLDLLGHLYFTGEGLDAPNIELAEKYLKRSDKVIESSQARSRSNIDLGIIQQFYYNNDTAAIRYYKRIVDSKTNNGIVNFQLANLTKKYPHLKLGDPFALMHTAYLRGYVPAIYEYARMTEQGINKRYNCEDTAYLFKSFIEEDEVVVAPHLKTAYAELLKGNSEVALWAYAQAAEQGIETALVSAAYLLYQLPYNFEEPQKTLPERMMMAIVYYTRAFKQDNLDAGVVAGDIYYLAGNYTSALSMYQSASLKFAPQAIWDLGYMYEHGLGVEKDFHLAKRYYDQVLEHNPKLYFAVKLSVWKLKLKSWLAWITAGKVNGWRKDDEHTVKNSSQPWYRQIVKSFQKAGRENSGGISEDLRYSQNQQPQHREQHQRQQQQQQSAFSSIWERIESLGLQMEDLVSIAFVLLIFLFSLAIRIIAARRGWNLNDMRFQVNGIGGNFEFQVIAI